MYLGKCGKDLKADLLMGVPKSTNGGSLKRNIPVLKSGKMLEKYVLCAGRVYIIDDKHFIECLSVSIEYM